MDLGTALAIGSAALSLSFAFVSYLRDGRRDQAGFLETKIGEMEEAHAGCQRELSHLRHELAWMRENMVLRPGAQAFVQP